MYVVGVDPGKSGGWAQYKVPGVGERGTIWDAGPIAEAADFRRLFSAFCHSSYAIIERAQGSNQMGASSSFEYGRNFGRIEGAAIGAEIDILYVSPQWWKGKLAVPVDKDKSQALALKRDPDLKEFVTLKKHNGIAEAALIASIIFDRDLFKQLEKLEAGRQKPKKKRTEFRL